jgi:hypothetical protein
MDTEHCRKQVDGPEASVRLGNESGNDIPGGSGILSDRLGDLEEMSQNLEQRVSELTKVSWLPSIDLSRTFFESASDRPEGGCRQTRKHVFLKRAIVSLRQSGSDLPPVVPNLLLSGQLIRQRCGSVCANRWQRWGFLRFG